MCGLLPADVQQKNPISAAIATSSKEKDAAAGFIRFLRTSSSIEAFRNAGLATPAGK
jgi:hypothetical protein